MEIRADSSDMKVFESLSSSTRIRILEILAEEPGNIGQLAGRLGLSSAIVTRHVALLEEAGLVKSENVAGKRGLQKVCSLAVNRLTVLFEKPARGRNATVVSIPVGQYSSYKVAPTCGLASPSGLIGLCDDPRYFSDPAHVNAALVWFTTGFVEYRIPSYATSAGRIRAMEISLEICSEYPSFKEDWPSDIHFSINGRHIGIWTSPGDFGSRTGTYTPDWWKRGTQYGLLKTIRIAEQGTMLDGIPLSSFRIGDIRAEPGHDTLFRIAVPKEARHPGGINLFGKGFGNYDQDIEIRVEYE